MFPIRSLSPQRPPPDHEAGGARRARHHQFLEEPRHHPRPLRRLRLPLIAAERTGRAARLMELDPKYVDVIVQRWQDYTGKKAVLDGEDWTFEDIKGARLGAAVE